MVTRLEAAEKLGISLKRLDGWEPTTRYKYRKGRMVASIPESEWDAEQRAWFLALTIYRASRCPHCGGDIAECGPKSAGRWKVPPPRRCYSTDALVGAQESSNRPRPQALLWRVEKVGK